MVLKMSETKIDFSTDSDGLFTTSPLAIDAHHSTSGNWMPVHTVEPVWVRDAKSGLSILDSPKFDIEDFEIVPGIIFDGSVPARNGLIRIKNLEIPDVAAEVLVFPNGSDRTLSRPMLEQIPLEPDLYTQVIRSVNNRGGLE